MGSSLSVFIDVLWKLQWCISLSWKAYILYTYRNKLFLDIADASNEIAEEAREIVNKLDTFSNATEAIIKTFDGVRFWQEKSDIEVS